MWLASVGETSTAAGIGLYFRDNTLDGGLGLSVRVGTRNSDLRYRATSPDAIIPRTMLKKSAVSFSFTPRPARSDWSR